MGLNFSENIEYCRQIVDEVSALLYYSHIPSAAAALLIGFFVLFRSNFNLLGKILFSISLTFCLWVVSNLLIWIFYYNNSLIMSVWATIEVFSILLFVLFGYFAYVFLEKKDLGSLFKFIGIVPVLASAFISTTKFNLEFFDVQECIAIENEAYADYFLSLKIFYSSMIVLFCLYKYLKADQYFKKEILLLSMGIGIFLVSFLLSGYVAEQTGQFIYEAAGLLGMVIFVGFLGYLIVKYKTFNIKLIATQALVITIIFLTGAGAFYANGIMDTILTSFTFAFICLAGYFLTKSVKEEVRQREKIESLAVELKDANVRLKENDRQKDELLSIVSHQLATPVSSIKWYTEMLRDGDLGKVTKQQKDHLTSMMGVAVNLSDLVSMILDVSRIQLGRMHIEKQELDLNAFFKEILEIINPKSEQKKVKFEVSMPKKLPKAMLDRRYTHMTIENLLSNAIKYTPESGSVHFNVELRGNILYCEVKDTGVGIPKADQEKIFGKMFRATNVRNEIDGNGFGLYVAKGAVEAQGGKIWFESTEGKGTTFFVELPLKDKKQ